MDNIAIIPARCGSRGLKDKNIKIFNGKPLIAYTIEAALESGIFKKAVVSTDSPVYAEIAREYGGTVPFLRSRELAADDASPWDAVKEVLQYEKSHGENYEVCALLQPTSPLRKAFHIQEAYQEFMEKKAYAVVSTCKVEHPVQWCFEVGEDGNMNQFSNSVYRNSRRQDLAVHYRENGAIYLVRPRILENSGDIYMERCYSYLMKQEYSIDIDSLIDFEVAEILYHKF